MTTTPAEPSAAGTIADTGAGHADGASCPSPRSSSTSMTAWADVARAGGGIWGKRGTRPRSRQPPLHVLIGHNLPLTGDGLLLGGAYFPGLPAGAHKWFVMLHIAGVALTALGVCVTAWRFFHGEDWVPQLLLAMWSSARRLALLVLAGYAAGVGLELTVPEAAGAERAVRRMADGLPDGHRAIATLATHGACTTSAAVRSCAGARTCSPTCGSIRAFLVAAVRTVALCYRWRWQFDGRVIIWIAALAPWLNAFPVLRKLTARMHFHS